LLRNFFRNSLSIMSGLSKATTSTTSCNTHNTNSCYLPQSHTNCVGFRC
jgi:hypothetical protein